MHPPSRGKIIMKKMFPKNHSDLHNPFMYFDQSGQNQRSKKKINK